MGDDPNKLAPSAVLRPENQLQSLDLNAEAASVTVDPLSPGTYRLTFDTGAYHRDHGISVPFFPEVSVMFNVRDTSDHYHVPLLVSPYGYSTYRGT